MARQININVKSLEDLLNEIDYAIAPYFEGEEYEDFHWSRTLKKVRDQFISTNGIQLEPKKDEH